MSQQLREDTKDFLCHRKDPADSVSPETRYEHIEREYLRFVEEYGDNKASGNRKYTRFFDQGNGVPPLTPLQFWKSEGRQKYERLSKIAVMIFSLSVSTASAERNFSTTGFIHSKVRNRLSRERVKKLVFVKENIHYIRQADARIAM